MEQFGKYMVFGIQLHEIWKLTFNVENYIFFMHSELVVYFCAKIIFRFSDIPKLSFLSSLFFSCTHHLPLPPSPVKSVGTLPTSSPTATHTSLPLAISSSPHFLPSFSLSFIPFWHHQKRRRRWQWWRTGVGGKKVRLVAIDGGNQ